MKSKTKSQILLRVVSSLDLTQNSQCSVYSIIRAFFLLFRQQVSHEYTECNHTCLYIPETGHASTCFPLVCMLDVLSSSKVDPMI